MPFRLPEQNIAGVLWKDPSGISTHVQLVYIGSAYTSGYITIRIVLYMINCLFSKI